MITFDGECSMVSVVDGDCAITFSITFDVCCRSRLMVSVLSSRLMLSYTTNCTYSCTHMNSHQLHRQLRTHLHPTTAQNAPYTHVHTATHQPAATHSPTHPVTHPRCTPIRLSIPATTQTKLHIHNPQLHTSSTLSSRDQMSYRLIRVCCFSCCRTRAHFASDVSSR